MKDKDRGLSAGIAAAACIAVAATCAALATLAVVREALPESDVDARSAVVAMAEPSATPEIVVRTREQRTNAAVASPARTAGVKTRPRTPARRRRPQVPPPGTAAAPAPAPAAQPVRAADPVPAGPIVLVDRVAATVAETVAETVAAAIPPELGELPPQPAQGLALELGVVLDGAVVSAGHGDQPRPR